jgi:hypothetical protein
MDFYTNSKGYNVIPLKSGKRVVASVMWKWHPYRLGVVELRSKAGFAPKTGWYEVKVVAGAGCKKYMKNLLQSHFQHGTPYEWPKFNQSIWNYNWNYSDGMNLFYAAHGFDQTDSICICIVDEAKRLMQTYVADNPNYFAP